MVKRITPAASAKGARKLTERQQRFVAEYLRNGNNAAAAYRFAYAANMAPNRISDEASKLLRHPGIAPVIAAAHAKAAKRLEAAADRYAVSKERISQELARLAFADARQLFTWGKDGVTVLPSEDLTDEQAAPVIEVSQTKSRDGGTIRVKLADKRQALIDLARLHGYVIDRKDVRMIRSVKDLTDDELAALEAELASKDEDA